MTANKRPEIPATLGALTWEQLREATGSLAAMMDRIREYAPPVTGYLATAITLGRRHKTDVAHGIALAWDKYERRISDEPPPEIIARNVETRSRLAAEAVEREKRLHPCRRCKGLVRTDGTPFLCWSCQKAGFTLGEVSGSQVTTGVTDASGKPLPKPGDVWANDEGMGIRVMEDRGCGLFIVAWADMSGKFPAHLADFEAWTRVTPVKVPRVGDIWFMEETGRHFHVGMVLEGYCYDWRGDGDVLSVRHLQMYYTRVHLEVAVGSRWYNVPSKETYRIRGIDTNKNGLKFVRALSEGCGEVYQIYQAFDSPDWVHLSDPDPQ